MQIKDYVSRLSRYRAQIMGFCILCVVLAHAEMKFMSGPLSYIKNKLWVIDIFFFLTGMSLYRSLKKSDAILPFYKRRLQRIYPIYLPVIIIYFIPIFVLLTDMSNLGLRLQQLLGAVSMTGWMLGMDNQFNWYLQSLMLFYLVTPGLFALIRSFEGNYWKILALIGFFVVTQVCFFGAGTMVAYSRTMPFVMGLAAADLADRGDKLRLNIPLVLIIWVIGNILAYYTLAMPLETSMYYGICWHPGTLVTPGMMLILCWIAEFCERHKALHWINSLFGLLGKYSLELYLVNVLIYDIIARLHIKVNGNLRWFIVALLIFPISILYGKLMEKFMSRKKTA